MRKNNTLPWEICTGVRQRTTQPATGGEADAEVSRGHSTGAIREDQPGRAESSNPRQRARDSTPMVPQPSIQLDLFEMPPRARDHGGTAITDTGEGQVRAASIVTSALTQPLMEQLCRHENLRRAYKRVKANRGAPGVDGMTIEELGPWLAAHETELVKALLDTDPKRCATSRSTNRAAGSVCYAFPRS